MRQLHIDILVDDETANQLDEFSEKMNADMRTLLTEFIVRGINLVLSTDFKKMENPTETIQ